MIARIFRAPALTAGVMLAIAPAVFFPAESAARQQSPDEIALLLAARVGTSLGPPGGETRSIAMAAANPARLYLGSATGHVFRSDDAGASWQELPVSFGHEAVVDNLVVAPDSPDHVFAAYWDSDGTGGLSESTDGGITWRRMAVPNSPSLRAITLAPGRPEMMYVGGIGGVWRSEDAGATWRNINGAGLVSSFIESLAVDPRDPDHIYAGTWRQVYRTRDGGETWRRIYQGMAIDRDIFSLTISPHDPDVVMAGTCNFLYRSNDGGGSWNERRSGLDRRHNRVHKIVHDSRDANTLFAGTRGALYRSDDAGRSWNLILPGVAVSGLVLDEANDRLYVATEERGLMIGPADGSAFAESNLGITTARVVAFDALPGAPRVLFAARADGAARATIYYSTDIGQTWKPLGRTPAVGDVRFMRAQPRPVNRLLVVSEGGWWSAYPGGRWEAIPAPPGTTTGIEIAPAVEGAVIATTDTGVYVARAESLVGTDGAAVPFDAETEPVWRPVVEDTGYVAVTVNNGRMLAVSNAGTIAGDVAALLEGAAATRGTLDGITGPIVEVAQHATDKQLAYAMTRTTVFRTVNGGADWQQLTLPWPASELRALSIDPARPDQILALDYRGAIYRGFDHGDNWLILDEDPGMDRAWSLRVTAAAPGYALVATQGHGLRVVNLDPLATFAGGGQE